MSDRFEWDDTNSSGIWWSTNVSIRDECIPVSYTHLRAHET